MMDDSDPRSKFKVYVIENSVNGKKYVGVTKESLKKRFDTHNKRANAASPIGIGSALVKYGSQNFSIRAVFVALSRDDMYWAETVLIVDFNSKAPFGYNLTDGGDGCRGLTISDETRRKLSISSTGRRHSEESKKLMSILWSGKKKSAEHKAKLSVAQTGRKYGMETRIKLSEIRTGKKHSDEWSGNISAGLIASNARKRALGHVAITAKLTWESVESIRAMSDLGFGTKDLCFKFGVSASTIRNIITGKSWKTGGVDSEPVR